MYNDNKYRHVCTSEISYTTHFIVFFLINKQKILSNKAKKKQRQQQKTGGHIGNKVITEFYK